MLNENRMPELDIPVVSIIKEISIIDDLETMNRIFNSFVEKGYNPLMVFLNKPNCQNEPNVNTLIVPEQLIMCEMPITEKIKNLRNIINKKVRENGYNIAITDSVCGIFPSEDGEYSEFLNMEMIEAFDPDYVIAHILAEDYLMPQRFFHQLELKIRRDIDAIIISNLFFDIVKYRENQTKRYLLFSEKTINRLTENLSKRVAVPVFSKSESVLICKKIEEKLSADIGNCRKVGIND